MDTDDTKRLAYSDFVSEMLSETPLIDGHNDLPAALRATASYSVEQLDSVRAELHTDIVKLRQGHVGAQFWSVWVPSTLDKGAAVLATLEQIDAVHRLVARYPRELALATTADELECAFSGGRIASLIGVEGGHAIGESLGALRMFARLGVRYMTLTHNDDTPWAASATGVRQTTGLSKVGRAIIGEMNRIGMMIDLSHTAESTQLQTLEASAAPVIFSHSSARALTDHPRNVSDQVLVGLRDNGGVVQIAFVPEFVSQQLIDWNADLAAQRIRQAPDRPVTAPETSPRFYPSAPRPGESSAAARKRNVRLLAAARDHESNRAEAATALWLENHPRPRVSVREVADHVEHARDVAGPDHIGIGADFDGTEVQPDGLENVSRYPELFAELASRGWSAADLRRLAGQNVLRVMRAVEDAASEPIRALRAPAE